MENLNSGGAPRRSSKEELQGCDEPQDAAVRADPLKENTHQALRLTCPASPPGRWPEQAPGPSAPEQQVIGVWGRCAFREAAECQAEGLCAFWPAVGQSQGPCAWRQAES